MKFYVIESHFQKPFEQFGEAVNRHRAYLQGGYDSGLLLCSGPKSDRSGGILIARAASQDAIDLFLADDPYCADGLAQYSVCEFDAVKQQAVLAGW